MRNKLRVFVVFVILIGLPIFAWYFLQKGSTMRKDALFQLQAKDVIDEFETSTENDIIVRQSFLKGKRWLISILGNDERRFLNSATVLNLYHQSKQEFKPFVMNITGLVAGESMPQITQLLKFKSSDSTWLNCYMADNHLFPFTQEVFNIPDHFRNHPCVILLDENLQIRNYYNLDSKDEIQKLVWQYPVFLSLKK
ncbi:MAG: hypothetical protein IT267_09380 [Saprospiraceae bacterium]|nr:hypothetical protein [Saprospiraceae bacterium]